MVARQFRCHRIADSNEIIAVAARCSRGSEIEPLVRLDIIKRHPLAAVIKQPEKVLRANIALLGGLPIPKRRQAVILRNATAGLIHVTENRLVPRAAVLCELNNLYERSLVRPANHDHALWRRGSLARVRDDERRDRKYEGGPAFHHCHPRLCR